MWYSTDELAKKIEAFKARSHNLDEAAFKVGFEKYMDAEFQKITDCVLAFKAGENILSGGQFDTLSLGTWIELFKAAKIPYVPAHMVGLIEDLTAIMPGNEMFEFHPPIELQKYNAMVRVDSCGSASLKALSEYGYNETERALSTYTYKNGKYYIKIDERVAHSILSYVGQIGRDGNTPQPIWMRPWVAARKTIVPINAGGYKTQAEWPVEWRVFVRNGTILGISNYYLQCPLQETAENMADVSIITEYTNKLIRYMEENGIQPFHPRYLDDETVASDELGFTVDFISTAKGPVALEAGPMVPLGVNNIPVPKWGAHPCCFIGKPVAGVAYKR